MYRWGHPMLSYLRRRCYWHWFLTERQEIRLVGAPTDYSGHRPVYIVLFWPVGLKDPILAWLLVS